MLFLLSLRAQSHSWVACTDYNDMSANPLTYDNTKCRGYPRSWGSVANGDNTFGADKGFNYQTDGNNICNKPFANPLSSAYQSSYPMATYTAGQKVCLAWPTKNHVAATCTNQYIPDTSLDVYMSPANPTSDPSLATFQLNKLTNWNAHQNGVIDFQGFQHCPDFCNNMDKSLCTQCFIVPPTTQPGNYVFLWYWVFNAGTAAYTTCWDAQVVASTGGAPAPAPAPGTLITDPPTAAGTVTTVADYIHMLNVPTQIPVSGAFTVDVAYTAGAAREIVIDILSLPSYTWHGKGTAAVQATSTKKTVTITITPETGSAAPVAGSSTELKAWIVDVNQFNTNQATSYAYELLVEEVTVTVGATLIQPTVPPTTPGSAASVFASIWVLVATLAALLH